ncbi:Ion channel [Candidatus Izimaplasma bacterium HR1]|jgi:hypothetical protein|uniref:potassium channel family protein n=1 Tax=Candidatus Izimoplasma sp. HR1 TaxID=1541959 RepID=UPI0004F89053|nr:Ion channel [Candidatus Izimaplasma bacterium HR1]
MAEDTKKTTKKKPAIKKPTTKKQTTKKSTANTTKKVPTAKKTSSPKKTSVVKKSTTTAKKPVTKKSPSSTKKKPSTTSPKKVNTKPVNSGKTTSKSVKNDKKSSNLSSRGVKTTKKVTKPKPKKRVKKKSELTTLEALEQAVDHKEIVEKQPLGKTFYLIFALAIYAIAFFYINNIVYDNSDLLQSGIFAFAAVFILFVLMLFNIHKLFINFFFLPFKRLFKQSRREINKEIMFSVGKNKAQTTFNKYKSLFTLILYGLLAGFLMYFSIMGSIMEGDKILKIITDAGLTLLIFLVVVCSWQYLFNIIPSILDKSIDARNGFILTLSAVILVIYVVFLLLDIVYLAEIMIFVLIIGFIALLGVNLNMIVGEINIFQNLRGRKSKVITRVVFIIFFGFHVYVILYASVVAYSIYNWEPNSFVFSTFDYKQEIITDLTDQDNEQLTQIYWDDDGDGLTPVVPLTDVYWDDDNDVLTPVVLLTEFYNDEFEPVRNIYDSNGLQISLRSEDGSFMDWAVPVRDIGTTSCNTFYNDGMFACSENVQQLHTYGDFLYWTVVTVSTIGYGDVHPSTEYNIAMGWGGFLGIYGLTFFALSISFVSNIAMEGVNSVREENKNDD